MPPTFPKEVLFEELENKRPKLDFDTSVPNQVTNFNEVSNEEGENEKSEGREGEEMERINHSQRQNRFS